SSARTSAPSRALPCLSSSSWSPTGWREPWTGCLAAGATSGARPSSRGATRSSKHGVSGHEEVGTVRETPPEVTRTGSAAEGAAGADGAVLACRDVTKSYGGVLAVDSVSLEVPRQGLFGLCGFNGAGEATLFNLLASSFRADSGSVRVEGRDATGWSAMRRARSGVAR